MEKKINKIHQKVADVLGMAVEDICPAPESEDLVPMPESTEIALVDNDDLPDMVDEMLRLEHVERQTDFVLDHVLPVVEASMADSLRMPPIYKARSIEANAKMLEAVKNLMQLKADIQFKKIESRMKQAAFTRNKTTGPVVTGNTFFINREEALKGLNVINAEINKQK